MRIMKTPRSVDLAITNRCNLRCKYCYHFAGPGDVGEDLPKERWLRFFKELKKCAVMDVTFAGGEPFCREDLRELIEGVVNNRMRFDILSNGTLITDEIAVFLASTGRCNGVQISIDGSKPETNDACRGKGNFHKAIEGIKCLLKHRILVNVRVTIHRKNVMDLEQIAELLIEKIGLSGFSTNAASYMGLCRHNAEEVGLTIEDRNLSMETLMKLNKKYENRISASAGPLAEATMWREMELSRRFGKKDISTGGRLTGCGCVMDKIAVRADGTIVPCSMLSHIELGRINRHGLGDIWQNHPKIQKMRDRRHIPLSDFVFCKGCQYMNYCTGNCPGLAYTITGDEDHPSPDACLKRFLEAGGRLPEMERCV